MSDLKVLFCSSEISPYAKTGGLADVTGALPAALKGLGCDVRLLMPLYRGVREKAGDLKPMPEPSRVLVGIHRYRVYFHEGATPAGIPVYFLEKDEFFDRSHLYGNPARGDYEDNAERFIAFSLAARALCSKIGWYPDVFHLHDWQTALAAVYCRLNWRLDPNFVRTGTVFTIHNLAYQGRFPEESFDLTHLPEEVFAPGGMEFWGQCNFLKAGLVYSDLLTTVSPTYAREIRHPDFGYGLEGVLQEREEDLVGILNGIDTTEWNPAIDPFLPAHFDETDLAGKAVCKKALLADLGLPASSAERPLLASISRLATQKGFDLLLKILDDLMRLPVTVVILGTGDPEIRREIEASAARHPERIRLLSQFDEALAHRIEAAADIFLMPSRYEPCGLNQMYSQRYGTVPVVHATGGLDDSVTDFTRDPENGTGFKFSRYEAEAFLDAVRAALAAYEKSEVWAGIRNRGMNRDFSWTRSAREYLNVYSNVRGRLSKRGRSHWPGA